MSERREIEVGDNLGCLLVVVVIGAVIVSLAYLGYGDILRTALK